MKPFLKKVHFYCIQDCVNCCSLSGGYVYHTLEEAKKIASFLAMKETDYLNWFTREIDNHLCLVDGDDENCIFLEDNACSIYAVRPMQCRTYPFWPENIKDADSWALTRKDCPGIGKGDPIDYQQIIGISKGQSLDSKR